MENNYINLLWIFFFSYFTFYFILCASVSRYKLKNVQSSSFTITFAIKMESHPNSASGSEFLASVCARCVRMYDRGSGCGKEKASERGKERKKLNQNSSQIKFSNYVCIVWTNNNKLRYQCSMFNVQRILFRNAISWKIPFILFPSFHIFFLSSFDPLNARFVVPIHAIASKTYARLVSFQRRSFCWIWSLVYVHLMEIRSKRKIRKKFRSGG